MRVSRGAAVLAIAAAAGSAGCSETHVVGGDTVGCAGGFLGDAASPLDFDLLTVNAAYDALPVADGGDVAILQPLQGGRVVFVGVRATNLDGCGVDLTGAVRDPASGQVRFDERTVNLLPAGDGWGTTGPLDASVAAAVANFANVPSAPTSRRRTPSTVPLRGARDRRRLRVHLRGGLRPRRHVAGARRR